ncbi:decaprenylphospho-beta-D-erythro-pentofuranosid-2-ulose 2-reductase [Georgenia sp. SYP-B2076]|uniref:decaprenylphospho-beta-D-erythro-pentofuranosid- 2-ulose 2-reductase n=1 Tax=Georgenia sp. SYP-B2076 TaxID=2495881 RepID=UPI000F8EDC74|nr:decaprenylphospho-beta-D-erythro-pentofuranosid-2-ulose 2-reductase [Georgenia sp. SYP-B2076]
MMNALGQPGTVLLVGGTSGIAGAIVDALLRSRPCEVVLAARPGPRRDAVARALTARGAVVDVVDIDAEDVDDLVAVLGAALAGREVDLAVVAHGRLPDQDALERDPAAAGRLGTVNFSSAVAVGLLLAQLMRRQGHGVIVALSSVAAVRPRASNYVYGATKAGLDAFFVGLGERLRGTGVRVLVVRPGFVRTRMTAGRAAAPFAVEPDQVAHAVLGRLARGGVVWVPGALGPVMTALLWVPAPLWRRLDR